MLRWFVDNIFAWVLSNPELLFLFDFRSNRGWKGTLSHRDRPRFLVEGPGSKNTLFALFQPWTLKVWWTNWILHVRWKFLILCPIWLEGVLLLFSLLPGSCSVFLSCELFILRCFFVFAQGVAHPCRDAQSNKRIRTLSSLSRVGLGHRYRFVTLEGISVLVEPFK